MRKLYVIDTNCLIAFYQNVFRNANNYNGSPELSTKTKTIISQAIISQASDVRLSIPSVVFIEIFEKWLNSEEFSRKFFYDVFTPLKLSPNIEIRPIDREVLENLIRIGGNLENHDLHDKLILATAMSLESPLITTDSAIIKYVLSCKSVPGTLN
jgi:PIN domain nuclease of toxin-antitoxin system